MNDDKMERLKKRLANLVYRDVEQKVKTILGNRPLPPKMKLIQLIYSYLNKYTKETLNKKLASFTQRADLVNAIIDNIVVYF